MRPASAFLVAAALPALGGAVSCGQFANCTECNAETYACHWCPDKKCHAIGSVYGCLVTPSCTGVGGEFARERPPGREIAASQPVAFRRMRARQPRIHRLRARVRSSHLCGPLRHRLRARLLLLLRERAAYLAGVDLVHRSAGRHSLPGAPGAGRTCILRARPRRRLAARAQGDAPGNAATRRRPIPRRPGLVRCGHPPRHCIHGAQRMSAWPCVRGNTDPRVPPRRPRRPGRQAIYMVVSPQMPRYTICTHELELRSIFSGLLHAKTAATYNVRLPFLAGRAHLPWQRRPVTQARRSSSPSTTRTASQSGWRRRRRPSPTRAAPWAAGGSTARGRSPPGR